MHKTITLTLVLFLSSAQGVAISSKSFMQQKSGESLHAYLELLQQSHNCNSNVDRLKMGPQDWTKIEGSGKLFTDSSFPADATMLSWKEYPRTVGGLAKYLNWFQEFKRPKDLHSMAINTKNPIQSVSLFGDEYDKTGKLVAGNIEQGSVGDNYLLTVAAALAERGDFIPKMFEQSKYSDEGIFTIKAFVKGRPEYITVDDVFPVYSHNTAFAKPTADGAWWLPLIEKAFAKVHVNYEMISSGTQAEAARFLTGAPSVEYMTNVDTIDELWSSVNNAVRNGYLITAACFIEQKGLVAGHGYIVKDFVVAKDSNGNEVNLVKMRNPYKQIGDTSFKGSSHGDWTGRFSQSDSTQWTDELKSKTKYEELKDGEFYMTIDDFKQGFKYYTITYLHDGWQNSFIEKRSVVNRRLYKFNFTITEDDFNSGEFKPSIPVKSTAAKQTKADLISGEHELKFEPKSSATETPSDQQNIQTGVSQQQKQFEILNNLSKHLSEGVSKLNKMADMDITDADDLADAMDIMVDSDVELSLSTPSSEEPEEEKEDFESRDQYLAQTEVEEQSQEELDDEAAMIIEKKTNQMKSKTQKESSLVDDKSIAEEGEKEGNLEGQAENQEDKSEKAYSENLIKMSQPDQQEEDPVALHEIKSEKDNKLGHFLQSSKQTASASESLEAYIGAEFYNKRMFPHGCPSYQKGFVKLFKVEQTKKGKEKLKLVDIQYFNNRDGFGFTLKNLTKGNYQIQFKKYSTGFDVFDFTVRMYAQNMIKMIDDELTTINGVQLTKQEEDKIQSIKGDKKQKTKKDKGEEKQSKKEDEVEKKADKAPKLPKQEKQAKGKQGKQQQKPPAQAAAPQNPPAQVQTPAPQTPAPQSQAQSPVPQPQIAVPQAPPTAPAAQSQEKSKEVNNAKQEQPKQSLSEHQNESNDSAESLSQGQETHQISKKVLAQKLQKATALADDSKNDKFFEIHRKENYYMKDAMDKKHGFYFLRVGSDSETADLSLKVKMFLKGDHVETTEDNEKVYVYKYPVDKFPGGDYKLTTYCNIRPEQGKKTCDFLVPTSHHDRTYVYVQKKIDIPSQQQQEPEVQSSQPALPAQTQ